MQNFKCLLLVCPEGLLEKPSVISLSFVLLSSLLRMSQRTVMSRHLFPAFWPLIPQDTVKYWTHFQQSWKLFRDFALGGEVQSVLLLNSGVISIFIDFYLAENSQLLCPEEKRASIGNNKVRLELWPPDPHLSRGKPVLQYC